MPHWKSAPRALLLGLCLALFAGAGPGFVGASTAQAQTARVSINIFFNDLQPYGTWVRHDRYQYVWVPNIRDVRWAPYTNGHWVYLQGYGWYFESDEDFA